jgi:hypothetical protein
MKTLICALLVLFASPVFAQTLIPTPRQALKIQIDDEAAQVAAWQDKAKALVKADSDLKPAVNSYNDRVTYHNNHVCTKKVANDDSCAAYNAEKDSLDAEEARIKAAFAPLMEQKLQLQAEQIRLNALSATLNDARAKAIANMVHYETPQFKADFNGPVTTSTSQGTGFSQYNKYHSHDDLVDQFVVHLGFSKDFPLTVATLDGIAKQLISGNKVLNYQRTCTDGSCIAMFDTTNATDNNRYEVFLFDSRTAFVLIERCPVKYSDDADWNGFMFSFAIKVKNGKACWLPGGCE